VERAAHHDDLERRTIGQLDRDLQRVGQDSQRDVGQRPGQSESGGTRIKENRVAGFDLSDGAAGDNLLFGDIHRLPAGTRNIPTVRIIAIGAPMGARELPLGLEPFEIPPDGFFRNPKSLSDLCSANTSLIDNHFDDAALTFEGKHERSGSRNIS